MSSDTILPEIKETMSTLRQLVSSFNNKQLNIIPFEGSWTAGQLVQHLVMSGSGFAQMVAGPVKDTLRAPDEMVGKIRDTFLNFNTKMKSPDFIVPANVRYDKEDLLNSLQAIQTSINHTIETQDLSKTCTGFELPVLGFLTRAEAIYFVIYHTQRHIHQLKKIHLKTVEHN